MDSSGCPTNSFGYCVIVDVVNIGNVRTVSPGATQPSKLRLPHLLPQPDLFFTNAKEQ